MNDPIKIEVNTKYKTVDSLEQNYLFRPSKYKETYLVFLLTQFAGKKIIIFTSTRKNSLMLALMLRFLNFAAVNINGSLAQQ